MEFSKVLIAVDESKYSEQAAKYGFEIGEKLNAEIALVNIVNPMYVMSGIDTGIYSKEAEQVQIESGKKLLELYKEKYAQTMSSEYFVRVDSPAAGILEVAKEWNASIIVIGRHGIESFSHILLGGVVDEVAKRAKIPVILVPFIEE